MIRGKPTENKQQFCHGSSVGLLNEFLQMKKSSTSYDRMTAKKESDSKMSVMQNDTDLLLDDNTEMMSVLNDLGELEDLTELYGDKDDII